MRPWSAPETFSGGANRWIIVNIVDSWAHTEGTFHQARAEAANVVGVDDCMLKRVR